MLLGAGVLAAGVDGASRLEEWLQAHSARAARITTTPALITRIRCVPVTQKTTSLDRDLFRQTPTSRGVLSICLT